ncbi:NYN domain-containing protein [Nakamurella aerolata]|uniref:RNA-binding protein n=1 Tax=Nakamurella aerolata TaxID=1656892 RepID=A0A849A862_9ACTN|nr:RNA-binding protein [Nakamurella aerolata]
MHLAELPEAVRTRVIAAAAVAVAAAPIEQLPAAVAAVARFAPAKRARSGAAVLAAAVESDAGFRALVATAVRDLAGPSAADSPGAYRPAADTPVALTDSPAADEADDVTAVALAYLAGAEVPQAALRRLRDQHSLAAARRRITELEREIDALAGRLAGESAAGGSAGIRPDANSSNGSAAELARLAAQAQNLQGRLREQGVRLRQARDEAEAARAELQELRHTAAQQRDRQQAEVARLEDRVAMLNRRNEAMHTATVTGREAQQRERGAADRRIELLLTALAQSVTGLRREWSLQSGGELPGDRVAAELRAGHRPAAPVSRVEQVSELLAVPGAHLIVDGYNVTKTGYPQLTLTDQRDRLIRSLSALAARTSAEITVVFDGAAVRTPPPAGRKIRVLFSPPEVIADDVIRRLVAAEPVGRTLLVVTSDRAIADDVAAAGAQVVPSELLLRVVHPLG